MTQDAAFLQAIRETPDDDAPRLIYADWLEEQGGAERTARAAFIRAQCRLAALPQEDPLRGDLEDEAADLLAEHEAAWTHSLRGIAHDWRFARGFLEHVALRGEDFLTDAEALFASAPIRSVHLLLGVKEVPALAGCPQLRWVEALDFRRCHLNDRALQQLLTSPHLGRLNALDLAGNGLNTPGMQALVQSAVFARLRHLDLSRNLGIGDRAVRLLSEAPQSNRLASLHLGETNIALDSFYALLHSGALAHLTDLNMAKAHLRVAGMCLPKTLPEPKGLERLTSLDLSATPRELVWPLLCSPRLSNLKSLRLRRMALTGTCIEALVDAPALAKLRHLDLCGNEIDPSGARALAHSPHRTSLTHLDLQANNLRDRGVKVIAESPLLRNLVALDLGRNDIGGPGLQALAAAPNLFPFSLRALHLAGNFIGRDSVQALAASPALSRLRHLDLGDASLDADSARALAEASNLARLTTLLLAKNVLGDDGARALAQSPHLRRLTALDLLDNRIGKAGAEALAAARSWHHLRKLDLRGNVFTDTQEALLRGRFGDAVQL